MSNTTKTRLVRIGNSRGVRIPKAVIEQLGLKTILELSVQANRLVVRSRGGRDKVGRRSFVRCTSAGTIE